MKQFMVMCAVLPILLIIIVQMSLDQINSYRISGINRCVFSVANDSRADGKYDYEELLRRLKMIGIDRSDVHYSDNSNESAVRRGQLFDYSVQIDFDKPMVGMMVSDKDNHYSYKITGCAASEKP